MKDMFDDSLMMLMEVNDLLKGAVKKETVVCVRVEMVNDVF